METKLWERLLEEKKKLVVPADHRLSDRDLIDPEELALETLPTLSRA